MIPAKYRYIVVEGPIGVGKTSLATRLADHLSAHSILEEPGANPFLPGFYRDMRRHALSTQLFFLFQRVNQVTELKQHDLFGRLTVADFLLEKDPLFARLTLDDAEFQLYTQIYQHVKVQAPQPDLVIYLQAPVDLLLERIQRRGMKMERAISEEYLRRLADSYTQFFYQYDAAPLLIVNSANLNFVDRTKDFELLLEHIGQLRGPREFLNRAA
jgi:deoxyadenosine/deoxycytidine kinase